MDMTTAKTALYDTLDRLQEARSDIKNDGSIQNYRTMFRLMAFASMAFDRINTIRLQQHQRPLKGDNMMRFSVHLLDILHEFFRTYRMFNMYLNDRNRQSHIQVTQDAMIDYILASVGFRMGFGPEHKLNDVIHSIKKLETLTTFGSRRLIPGDFVTFIAEKFCTPYIHAFKAHGTTCKNENMKTKRLSLIDKKKYAMNSVNIDDTNLDRVSSSSLHMYFPHYRACDALWQGFEHHFFHCAKNVLGIASNANAYDTQDRFPLIAANEEDELLNGGSQLWRLWPNNMSKNKNPWV
jgi:hypothetical protein